MAEVTPAADMPEASAGTQDLAEATVAEVSAAAVTWVAATSPAACDPARLLLADLHTVLPSRNEGSHINRISIMDSAVPAFTPTGSATTATGMRVEGIETAMDIRGRTADITIPGGGGIPVLLTTKITRGTEPPLMR